MGLIKAFAGALSNTLANQWLEYFYCDSLSNNVLMVKGQQKTGKKSSNTKGEENTVKIPQETAIERLAPMPPITPANQSMIRPQITPRQLLTICGR